MRTITLMHEALPVDGVVTSTDLLFDPENKTVVLTIGCSTTDLAEALFEALAASLRAGECRLGDLALTTAPGVFAAEAS